MAKRLFINSLYLRCSCSSHMIEFTPNNYDNGELNVSFWRKEITGQLSFINRIKWCINILITGYPWSDQVLLSKENVNSLKNYLFVIYDDLTDSPETKIY